MSQIDHYISAVRMQSREAFLTRYRLPFVLVKTEDMATADAEQQGAEKDEDWSGHTRMTRVVGRASSFAVLRHNASFYRVHELSAQEVTELPAEGAEVAGRPIRYEVTVGRTDDNDVKIEGQAISARHAKFVCSRDNAWFLIDCGSRNGTSVNGTRLKALAPQPVSFGDPITMGDVALMIIGAGALYEMVSAQLATRGRNR